MWLQDTEIKSLQLPTNTELKDFTPENCRDFYLGLKKFMKNIASENVQPSYSSVSKPVLKKKNQFNLKKIISKNEFVDDHVYFAPDTAVNVEHIVSLDYSNRVLVSEGARPLRVSELSFCDVHFQDSHSPFVFIGYHNTDELKIIPNGKYHINDNRVYIQATKDNEPYVFIISKELDILKENYLKKPSHEQGIMPIRRGYDSLLSKIIERVYR